jgi:hypothetical protein
MNVKLIRLTSGEDIVANLISENDDSIIIENAIVAVPSGRGELGFAPWSPLLSKNVKELTISKNFVIYVSETQDQIVEQYSEIFSPIITPSKTLAL